MTDSCNETCDRDCIHEEEGCLSCGTLYSLSDDSYCDECEFDRACLAADLIYDRMKEGD